MDDPRQRKWKSYAVVFILLSVVLLPFCNDLSIAGTAHDTLGETEYWALLVGVGDYAENPMEDRPDMIREVNDFDTQLLRSDWWPSDHVKVLTGENATIVNIIAGLRWLDRMDDNNDISLVYFSTHGFPLGFDIPPKDEADGTDEALVSYWGFSFPTLVIWDDELNVLLNRLESKGVCLIVDSCYAGGFNDPPNWNLTSDAATVQQQHHLAAERWAKEFGEEVRGQKRVVLMASCEDEEAVSGGFGPYLVDGIRGYADANDDGIVSAEELFAYAETRSAQMQQPTMYDGYDGELPLISVPRTASHSNGQAAQQSNVQNDDATGILMKSAETSLLCGYVKDANTSNPIDNATVYIRGRINEYEYYENQTTTDSVGFYQMNTPAIRIRMTVSADGYCDLSSGPYQIQENMTYWVNISLAKRPPETAIICGYITDKITTNPLDMVNVSLSWQGPGQQYYQNDTTTGSTGFYQMNVAAGSLTLQMEKEGYFTEYVQDLSIQAGERLWMNVSLNPHPLENAVVCGYVTDAKTGNPLSNLRLDFEWVDFVNGSSYGKETQTNTSGFYTLTMAPGELYISIRGWGYEFYDPYRHDAVANTTVWVNCSLTTSSFEMELNQPLNALYMMNRRIMPMRTPRIIGTINISVYIPGGWGAPGNAEKIEVYIDGTLKATLTEQPYNWTWSQRTIGKHIIKVIAYDFNGDTASKEIEVHKFF